MTIESKLKELGINIPDVGKPVASYVPFTIANNIVYVSGQLPAESGDIKVAGIVGKDVSLEDAQKAARICAINLIAVVKAACNGDLSKVKKVLNLTVLVASSPDFTSQHLVANGASDLFVEVFGNEIGSHSRAAFGIASIPRNGAVEIAGIFEIS